MSIERSQIYYVNLDPVQGREQAGKRPVLVISSDRVNRLPLVVTVGVGTKATNIDRDYPTNVRVSPDESGLPIETILMYFQMRSLDRKRFSDAPVGQLFETKMKEVEAAVRYCLGL